MFKFDVDIFEYIAIHMLTTYRAKAQNAFSLSVKWLTHDTCSHEASNLILLPKINHRRM